MKSGKDNGMESGGIATEKTIKSTAYRFFMAFRTKVHYQRKGII